MNKSERLHDMLLFLNDKNSFHLRDLMEKYEISKSTALRDIQSIEAIGMPIYSEKGRNGYYGVLRNRLLSPIIFNLDEVFALYFSMLTLRAYETTPFHISVETLKEKFENCLSKEKIELLHRVETVFQLGSIKHNNHCLFLKDILEFAIEEKVCTLKYTKNDVKRWYQVQFFDISSSHGQWYATGYNFESECTQVFRCDKILEVKPSNMFKPKPLSSYQQPADILYKAEHATDFEVGITEQGVDLFYKEHYPSMTLCSENGQYSIRGFYNKGEENFIANYLIGYQKNIISIKPSKLKTLMLNNLNSIKGHLQGIETKANESDTPPT